VTVEQFEQWLAALCIWREARGEHIDAKRGVWFVILNRMNDQHRRWPRSITDVILQHDQFSSFSAGDPNSVRFPRPPAEGATPSRDWQAFTDCVSVVTATNVGDPTNGANLYESLPEGAPKPSWATPEMMTAHIGTIRFYKS
jgi:spore germination cell wall hydrolase CwlJ-like protein